LIEEGAIVATISRSCTPELSAIRTGNSSRLLIQECDITNGEAVANAISVILKTFQRLDSVVLNAGIMGPLERIADTQTLSEWKHCFDVNFFSLVQMLQLVTESLVKSEHTGRVVFVSSGAAIGGTAAWGAYSASKAAVNSLCRTYANEQANIISVAIRPGVVATEMQAAIREHGSSSMKASELSRFIEAHKEGTLLAPEVPGCIIASLALRSSRILSGSFISWDSDECKDYRKSI